MALKILDFTYITLDFTILVPLTSPKPGRVKQEGGKLSWSITSQTSSVVMIGL